MNLCAAHIQNNKPAASTAGLLWGRNPRLLLSSLISLRGAPELVNDWLSGQSSLIRSY